ncbi:hypothetical protein RRG08_033667 [Elysia crispata]|uniref:CUB domain-containing protein n=1 Tax=Elysia crispata TaxID=231223 RepID=A0AAE1DUC2_9GAST|nr:hypothetical protein RRG08_033667 [Elysia crispata]
MERITFFGAIKVAFVLLILNVFPAWAEETYFDTMERQCGETILLSSLPKKSLVLMLTEQVVYAPLFDCHVTVAVSKETRIYLSFLEMDIRSYGACAGDFLTIIDSEPLTYETFYFQDSSVRRYCGNQRPKPLASTGNNITIRFVSDEVISGRGFSLLLTAFHEAECLEEEFRCGNNRCIDHRLKCDDNDNCGDGSDNCDLPVYIIACIAVASIITLVAGLFLTLVIRYRCRHKQLECEETNSEEDNCERSRPIHSIPIAPVRYSAVVSDTACVSAFISRLVHVTHLPSYEQLYQQPQHVARTAMAD